MRRLAIFPTAALLALAAACSTFGSGDDPPARGTDQTDVDASGDATDVAEGGGAAFDASEDASSPPGDAGPLVIQVPPTWRSPNGAVIAVNEEGTRISDYGAYNHPVIVPAPAIDLASDDYTLIATVRATNVPAEFGIITRFADDTGGLVWSARYGTDDPAPAFIGTIGPALGWNIAPPTATVRYNQTAKTRWRMVLRASGITISGKLWDVSKAEPPGWMLNYAAMPTGARGVGFYVYGKPDIVLEDMTITVP